MTNFIPFPLITDQRTVEIDGQQLFFKVTEYSNSLYIRLCLGNKTGILV
jgi:hypothetical protein